VVEGRLKNKNTQIIFKNKKKLKNRVGVFNILKTNTLEMMYLNVK